jgi:uncharacterized lipoprotein YmbA
VGGCGSSPPKQFYTLSAVPPAQADAPSPGNAVPIQISAVHVPPVLDRQEMVREIAPNTVQLSDTHRWGAPLADMMRNVLTQDLLQRLPAGRVIPARMTPPPGTHRIAVDVLKLECDPVGSVVLDGAWSVFEADSDTALFNQHATLTGQANPADYGDQVRVMSQLLGQLADQIAVHADSIR